LTWLLTHVIVGGYCYEDENRGRIRGSNCNASNGIVVVMIVAWLTLPSDEEQIVNRACFQQCKEVISSNGGYGQLDIFSGPVYFEEMGKCHRDCTKGIE
jgi:hypothetical protein